MARDLSGRIMIGGIVAAALALAVTAAVTFATVAHSQPTGSYTPVITNLKTGKKAIWQRHSYPDQNRCDAALGNLPAFLVAVSKQDPDAKVPELTGDRDLIDDVSGVIVALWQNTGVLPNLTISCERLGDPV